VTIISSSKSCDLGYLQEHIQNSTLAGGVAVGTCCHMMLMPYAAILIGCTAATVSVVGYLYITVSVK